MKSDYFSFTFFRSSHDTTKWIDWRQINRRRSGNGRNISSKVRCQNKFQRNGPLSGSGNFLFSSFQLCFHLMLKSCHVQCFLCKTKGEFTEFTKRFQSDTVDHGIQPLFEITKTGHAPWLSRPANDQSASATGCTQEGDQSQINRLTAMINNFPFHFSLSVLDFDQLTNNDESDEEFEFIT